MGAIACHRRQLRAPNCIASRKAGSQQRSSGGTFRPDTGSSLNIEIVLKRPLFFGRFGRGGAFPSARASSLIGVADLAVPLFAPATLDRRARLVDAPCHAGDVKAPLVAEAGARPWVRALVGTGSGTGRGGVQRLRVLGRPMPRDPRRANRWVAQGQRPCLSPTSPQHFAEVLAAHVCKALAAAISSGQRRRISAKTCRYPRIFPVPRQRGREGWGAHCGWGMTVNINEHSGLTSPSGAVWPSPQCHAILFSALIGVGRRRR